MFVREVDGAAHIPLILLKFYAEGRDYITSNFFSQAVKYFTA